MSAVDDNDSGVNEEINLNDIDTDAKSVSYTHLTLPTILLV